MRVGRPPKADAEVLRSQLLTLIERDGYEHVSMGVLADAVGMSVRTLHRYFPAKADIVWGGIETSTEALTDGLRAADDSLPIIDTVSGVVTGVFARNTEDLDTMRARLRLIALSPELRTNRSATFEGWRQAIIEFIALRRDEPADSLVSVAAGAALHTALMEALGWWALRSEIAEPASCIADALRGLSIVAGPAGAGYPRENQ